MEQNLYYRMQDKATPYRSALLGFVAADTYVYRNKFLL